MVVHLLPERSIGRGRSEPNRPDPRRGIDARRRSARPMGTRDPFGEQWRILIEPVDGPFDRSILSLHFIDLTLGRLSKRRDATGLVGDDVPSSLI